MGSGIVVIIDYNYICTFFFNYFQVLIIINEVHDFSQEKHGNHSDVRVTFHFFFFLENIKHGNFYD